MLSADRKQLLRKFTFLPHFSSCLISTILSLSKYHFHLFVNFFFSVCQLFFSILSFSFYSSNILPFYFSAVFLFNHCFLLPGCSLSSLTHQTFSLFLSNIFIKMFSFSFLITLSLKSLQEFLIFIVFRL